MYAIIKSGSRQYRVTPNSVIEVFRLALEEGGKFETDQVLLVHDEKKGVSIGTPFVEGATVKGTLVENFRGKKIIVFKQKRRKGYKRTRGHRQELSRVRIDNIQVKKATTKSDKTTGSAEEKTEQPEK